MKTSRNPTSIHSPLASYVHQIEVSADEKLLVLSGQVGVRRDGSIPEDTLEQFNVAWQNVDENLRHAGMTPQDIVKMTIYMVEQIDPLERRSALASMLDTLRPCMTLLYVVALGTEELKVEIDVMASA